ncbi:hypothetical protein Aiant_22410 [Actinoplanes ianthinogenes]|uniref:Uncharacterized protein n=1 Tax=Actinoplanes ianthinogenes TaxID=122358 RepID=A0ABM7LQQ2_9ACTN|nr:hypothetical protein Aiant_22410 [Actinoplanes ianthinogenes]
MGGPFHIPADDNHPRCRDAAVPLADPFPVRPAAPWQSARDAAAHPRPHRASCGPLTKNARPDSHPLSEPHPPFPSPHPPWGAALCQHDVIPRSWFGTLWTALQCAYRLERAGTPPAPVAAHSPSSPAGLYGPIPCPDRAMGTSPNHRAGTYGPNPCPDRAMGTSPNHRAGTYGPNPCPDRAMETSPNHRAGTYGPNPCPDRAMETSPNHRAGTYGPNPCPDRAMETSPKPSSWHLRP